MAETKKINWSKFDKKLNWDNLNKDIKEAEENGLGDYPDIPDGQYEVKIKNMELGESKVKDDGSGGDPMLKIQFQILEGEFKDQLIFYNGVMQAHNEKAFGMQVHRNNEMLRAIWDAEHDEVQLTNFSDYNDLILDIAEEVIEDEWEYILEKGQTKKGYDTYKIIEILSPAE